MIHDDFIILKKFVDDDTMNFYLNINRQSKPSTVGVKNVNPNKKKRNDIFFKRDECFKMDNLVFAKNKSMIDEHFGTDIMYRETYKMGIYTEAEQGFYILHTDKQGGFESRVLSMVVCLSNSSDYEGGYFKLDKFKKKIKFDKGDAIIFKSELYHGVEPVTKGVRKVLITFLYDKIGMFIRKIMNKKAYMPIVPYFSSNKRYIYPILSNSGPGNQIMGIKEAILLGIYLRRLCIIPNLVEHYTIGMQGYKITDVLSITFPCVYEEFVDIDYHTKYCAHNSYYNKVLKQEISIPRCEEKLLQKRIFNNNDDMNELREIKDKTLVIKHIFNNVAISKCRNNGCNTCELNNTFGEFYKLVCENFDFSVMVKTFGNNFITNNIKEDFIAIHVRYPDVGHTSIVDENELANKLIKTGKKVFISSNKHDRISRGPLKQFHKFVGEDRFMSSFIDQYICAKSFLFVMSDYNDYRFVGKPHQRSTWSSFVKDYRLYLLKIPPSQNILLSEFMKRY